MKYIAIGKIGEKHGISRNRIFLLFQNKGLILKINGKQKLTKKSKNMGGLYKNYFGNYIVLPFLFRINDELFIPCLKI